MNLKELSTAELEKKYKTTAALTYTLAGMLIVLLVLAVYLSVRDGFNALVVVPLALSTIVITNLRSIKLMKAELAARETAQ
ncbi:MAG: redox-active disulfide protein 2 [Sphingobacteriales bacterium]|nr:MAG: redox-active disulfide protein 2 [Sphingobacteriales bacterium]